MAAKTAGENGLNVALLERKSEPYKIQRSCATMFAVEDGFLFGERMYFNHKQKKLVFPINGFTVDYDGPYKNFYGQVFYSANARAYIQFGDYEANLKKGDKGRLSVVYDKETLLYGLINDAKKHGVKIFGSANVINIRNKDQKVYVYTADGRIFCAPFVIAADGINSRIARILGFNKERKFYGTVATVSYDVVGIEPPFPYTYMMTTYFEPKNHIPITCGMVPRAYGKDVFWVYGGGPADHRVDYSFELKYFMEKSPFSSWFKDPKIDKKRTAVLSVWSPIVEPFKDNVLVIGDAAWCIEAECTGSMMCGRKAAQTITFALKEGKINREGVEIYLRWWKKSFIDYDYRGYLRSLAMLYLVDEQETEFLYSLISECLPATLNPHKAEEIINSALMEKIPQIQAKRPQLLLKFQQISGISLERILRSLIRCGFPSR